MAKPMREIKSFVCRNRNLTENQRDLLNTYYPKWGLVNNQNWDFNKIFNNNNKIVLEIGFGTGDTLIKNAINNPNSNYIGIEVYQAGCINILNYLKNNKINNLRICQGDAKEILFNHIADKSLTAVQIFFPDPWPKQKHHKRRLIQTDFINLLASKIKLGGLLHTATDWVNYAEHMIKVLNSNNNYNNSPNNQELIASSRLLTKFEQKGLTKGHKIRDLIYTVIN